MNASHAAVDAVVFVGIDHVFKVLVVLDQFFGQAHTVLDVHVVVASAVDEQVVAFEFARVAQGRVGVVAFGILGGGAHVALRVDVVVEAPVGHRSDGNGGFEDVGTLGDAMGSHEASVAPAPDADAAAVHVGAEGQGLSGGDLVLRLVLAQLQVGALGEVASLTASSAVVHTDDPIAFVGEHLIPEVVTAAKVVGNLLATGAAVQEHQDGVLFARVKVGRLHLPGWQALTVGGLQGEEGLGRERIILHALDQFGVVL